MTEFFPFSGPEIPGPALEVMVDNAKHILLVMCQALPGPEQPATGGSIRAGSLGAALAGHGHRVTFAVPSGFLGGERQTAEGFSTVPYKIGELDRLAAKLGADILLFANWGLAAEAPICDLPTIIDMNGPLVLENHYRGRGRDLDDSLAKLKALGRADLLLAGSETQKAYLTAWVLAGGGNVEHLGIEVVPFFLPGSPPPREPGEDLDIVLAGYDWPWLDGVGPVQVVAEELARRGRGTLHLFTASASYHDSLAGEDSSADRLGHLRGGDLARVVQHRPLPFAELATVLGKATVALDVWQRNSERELAFPSRTVTYLWAGLPVIIGNYGELARLVESYRAGWLVDPADPAALARVIDEICREPETVRTCGENAARLYRERFSGADLVAPVAEFCRKPGANLRSAPLIAHLEKASEDLARSREECRLMGEIHRQPRGFTGFSTFSRLGRRFRRVRMLPILLYLAILSWSGEVLHRLRTGRGGVCGS